MKSQSFIAALACTLGIIFGSQPLSAATVTVTTTVDEVNGTTTSIAALTGNPGGAGISLREAIIAANNTAGADVINLPAGTYTLTRVGNDATCQNGDLDINDSLTINGAGAGTTIIQGATDAAFTGSIGDKIIGINQDGTHPSLTVSINSVTIRYGRNTIANTDPLFAYSGAGVDVFLTGSGNNISFTGCVINNNQNVNAYGGGMNIDSANGGVNAGTVTLTGCTIVSNSTVSTTFTATGAGVNLFSDIHNVSLINCVIANNQTASSTSANGAGINIRHSNGGIVTVNNCTVTNNTAGGSGGGIMTASSQTLSVTGGVISGNTSGASGGGICVNGNANSPASLTNVLISANHANLGGGGGVYEAAISPLVLQSCVISNNTAGTGGGIHHQTGTLTMNDGAIVGNSASTSGGGFYDLNGSPTLTRVLIMSNSATTSGGGIFVAGGTLSATYCRIVNNSAPTGKSAGQSAGTATVVNNWWGTNNPASLMSGTVGFTPWLQLGLAANPATLFVPNATTLTASFLTNSAGTFIPVANLSQLIGLPITFNNAVRGTLSGAQTTIQASGTATATFTANAAGAGSAAATVDNQTLTASITIPTGVSSINRAQTSPTNLASVQWTVTFTNAVSGLVAANFTLVNGGLGGSPGINSVTAVGGAPATSWTVTASTGTGSGTLGLNMANGTGVSAVINNLPFTGQVYTIDLVAPNTSITGQPAALTNTASATFTFTGSDTGAGVAGFQCRLDGAAFTNCTSPVNFSGLASATHVFDVRSIDGAGNVDASPASYTWTVDTILPTLNCSTDIVYTTGGACPAVVNYTVSVSDNLALAVTTTNPASGSVFPIGTNTVALGARDTAGNTNYCTFKVIVVQGAAPQLSIVKNNTNMVVSWAAGYPCYTLQTATGAVNSSWSLYSGPFATNGGVIYVTNSTTLTNRFYRLSY